MSETVEEDEVNGETQPTVAEASAIVVTYTDTEIPAFKESMVSNNTNKTTNTSVRRLKSWYQEKHGNELDLNTISKQEAPQLLKHFFIEQETPSSLYSCACVHVGSCTTWKPVFLLRVTYT